MTARTITKIVAGCCLAILVAWNLYAAFNNQTDDTISVLMRDLSQFPMIPFVLGIICGHWFWPMEKQ